jgi:hypothetical protein
MQRFFNVEISSKTNIIKVASVPPQTKKEAIRTLFKSRSLRASNNIGSIEQVAGDTHIVTFISVGGTLSLHVF